MDITLFGMMWIFLLIILLVFPIKYTIGLLLISIVFQSTAVINLGDKGITPTLVTEVYLFFKYLIIRNKNYKIEKSNLSFIKTIILFLIFSVVISFTSSLLFQNLEIYDLYDYSKVSFSITNSLIIRIIILFFNISSLYIIYKLKDKFDNIFINKIVLYTLYIVIIIGLWEFLWKATGKIFFFPEDFFYNNIGYALGHNQGYLDGQSSLFSVRMNSTFLEASYLGCYLVAMFFAILSIQKHRKKKNIYTIIAILICLLFNLSGTGLISFFIMMIIYIFIENRKVLTKTNVLLLIFLIPIAFLALYKIGYINKIYSMLSNKMSSLSGIERSLFNKTAWIIFLKTYFLGGGLSCYRASSLFFSMLCTVGIVGVIILYYGIIKFLNINRKKFNYSVYYKFGYFYLLSIFIGMNISIPDITFLPLWCSLFYLIALKGDNVNEKNRYSDIKL